MGFVSACNFVEHYLCLCDMLTEKSRHLLNSIDILTDNLARLRGDLFAAAFVLGNILDNSTGEFAASDRKDA